jgi:DNA-binding response OmpR family regulator
MIPENGPKTSGSDAQAGGRQPLRFDDYVLDAEKRELRHRDQPVHLSRLPFEVLSHLIERRPALVTREELLERHWSRRPGGDEALTRCLSTIRKELGDSQDPPRFIETRHGVGYRFIAAVELAASPAEVSTPAGPHINDLLRQQAVLRYLAFIAGGALLLALGVVVWSRFEIERAVAAGERAIAARELGAANPAVLRRQFERMRSASVLWIDDHPDTNQAEREALEHAGLRVDTALSNAQAADRMRGREYDLVISDIGRDAPQAQRAGLNVPRELLPDRNRLPPLVYYVRKRESPSTEDGYPVLTRPSELFGVVSELLGAPISPEP